jgi:hypothetical protein
MEQKDQETTRYSSIEQAACQASQSGLVAWSQDGLFRLRSSASGFFPRAVLYRRIAHRLNAITRHTRTVRTDISGI